MSQTDLHSGVRVDHVHLRVTNLDRSTVFYRDVLGFRVTMDSRPFGWPAVFLATRDDQHHIVLNAAGGVADAPVPRGQGRLYHFAVRHPDPMALAESVIRLLDCQYPLSHAADHGGTVSIYLHDPDGNAVELYYDRPPSELATTNNRFVRSEPFDPAKLLEVLARRPAA